MDFGESFVTLFTEMHTATAVLLACGFILVLIEMFAPGFGVFGITGGCALVAGIIVQLFMSDYNWMQTIILIFLNIIVLAIALVLVMWLLRKKWFLRSPLVQNETALPMDEITKGTEDFSFLLNQEGVVRTFMRPVGKAEFSEKEYDVMAYQGAAYKEGTKVRVVEVEGQRIVVKALD